MSRGRGRAVGGAAGRRALSACACVRGPVPTHPGDPFPPHAQFVGQNAGGDGGPVVAAPADEHEAGGWGREWGEREREGVRAGARKGASARAGAPSGWGRRAWGVVPPPRTDPAPAQVVAWEIRQDTRRAVEGRRAPGGRPGGGAAVMTDAAGAGEGESRAGRTALPLHRKRGAVGMVDPPRNVVRPSRAHAPMPGPSIPARGGAGQCRFRGARAPGGGHREPFAPGGGASSETAQREERGRARMHRPHRPTPTPPLPPPPPMRKCSAAPPQGSRADRVFPNPNTKKRTRLSAPVRRS